LGIDAPAEVAERSDHCKKLSKFQCKKYLVLKGKKIPKWHQQFNQQKVIQIMSEDI
jgi:hypothetical protein